MKYGIDFDKKKKQMTMKTKIVARNREGSVMGIYDTPKDAALGIGKSPSAAKRIHDCLCYKNQTDFAYGFYWDFMDIEDE